MPEPTAPGVPGSSLSIFARSSVLDRFRRLHSPSGSRGFPPHITVLHPFMPASSVDDAVLARLASLCAEIEPFTVALTRTAWFPGPLLYLGLEPEEPVRALTAAVVAAFPGYPPYAGLHPDGIPHLTIGQGDAVGSVESAVRQQLPITIEVSELYLTVDTEDPPEWSVRAVLPLGSRARDE